MKEPNYDTILKAKIDYYGETKAAYHFAAEEYAKLSVQYDKFVNDQPKKVLSYEQFLQLNQKFLSDYYPIRKSSNMFFDVKLHSDSFKEVLPPRLLIDKVTLPLCDTLYNESRKLEEKVVKQVLEQLLNRPVTLDDAKDCSMIFHQDFRDRYILKHLDKQLGMIIRKYDPKDFRVCFEPGLLVFRK